MAIQNARLFRDLADKNHQLEVASQHISGELNEKQEEYLRDIDAVWVNERG